MSSSLKPAERDPDEQGEPKERAIEDEGPSGEALQDPHQTTDRHKGRNRCDDQSEDQHQPCMCIDMRLVQIPHFFEPDQSDDAGRHLCAPTSCMVIYASQDQLNGK